MKELTVRGGFALAPQSMTEAMTMATMLCKSSMVPKCYTNKPEDTLIAMMMGSELGLNPIQSLQNIAVINGKPSIYGDALAALVQNHPAFGGMEESFNETGMVATCTVWRKGGTKHTQTFGQADAQKANLWGKAGPWTQYPKRMLAMRARGFALRSQFADALAGLITREEAEDMPQQLQDYTAPTAIAGEVVNSELDGYLDGINNASNMEFLQQAFATSWKACTSKSDREALTRAKDARKAQLAVVSEVSDAAA
jgi:hypothetical protein